MRIVYSFKLTFSNSSAISCICVDWQRIIQSQQRLVIQFLNCLHKDLPQKKKKSDIGFLHISDVQIIVPLSELVSGNHNQ